MLYKVYYQENKKQKSLLIESESFDSLVQNPSYPSNIIKIIPMQKKSFFSIKKNINQELYLFLYEFYFLLISNLTILESIEIMKENRYSKDMEKIVQTIYKTIINGKSIYMAIKDDKNISQEIKYFLFIADKTNNYTNSIKSLLDLLEELKEIKKRFFKVLFYPFILLISIIATCGILLFFVLPEFESIFNSFDGELPFATQFLLDLKNFILLHSITIFIIIFIVSIGFYFFQQKYKAKYDKYKLQYIPFYKSYILYQFLLAMQVSLQSHIQFIEAISFCERITSNEYFKKKIISIKSDMENGLNPSDAFYKSALFDLKTIRLLHIIDITGDTQSIFASLVSLEKENFVLKIDRFSKLIEPLLILILGLLVLFIIVAILSPIWELSSVLD